MFKRISVKKVKIITAITCVLIGIIICVANFSSLDNIFSFDTFVRVIGLVIVFPGLIYLTIYILIFADRDGLEENISYVQNILSKEEYREINLKLEDNEFLKLSVEESAISYYAKIKSDKEVEISIRKDEKELSNKTIDVFCFRRCFTE